MASYHGQFSKSKAVALPRAFLPLANSSTGAYDLQRMR
jgi:hypothetical protein